MTEWREVANAAAVLACAVTFCAGLVGGCNPPPPAQGPSGNGTATKPVAPVQSASASAPAASGAAAASGAPAASGVASAKPFDQCDNSPPLAKQYFGVLKDARCDYDRFPIMADVATMLGVECNYCHVSDPANPKKELYPEMTPKKEKANWMRMHLMKAVKPADGSELKCSSCHSDDKGKPVAKILGNPRDETRAHEWMSLVMTKKFVVAATGEKLKCKHCHVGNYKTPDWHPKVILTDHISAH
jgi:hypothetical protein